MSKSKTEKESPSAGPAAAAEPDGVRTAAAAVLAPCSLLLDIIHRAVRAYHCPFTWAARADEAAAALKALREALDGQA
jgi:hypothetical protein